MSRPAKLLIAITLLVLLAIPALYVACTWSTENPLRFEAVRLEMEPSRGRKDCGILHLTVTNVSKLPVYLSFAVLEQRTPGESAAAVAQIGAIIPQLQDRPEKTMLPLYLPPGGSMQCIAFVVVQDVNAPQALQHINVDYRWRSGTGEEAHDLWIRCIYGKMDWLEKLITAPGEQRHRSPLLTLPASASAQSSSTEQGSGE